MRRRDWLIALACALGWPALETHLLADDPSENILGLDPKAPGNDFENTLKSGIKARRPSEIAFAQLVAQKVRNNELPLSLVRSTYLWARRQPRYPALYFEQALRLRAGREGILLD